jgi:hypothetical protein
MRLECSVTTACPANRYRREYGRFSRTPGQLVDSKMARLLPYCKHQWVLYPADFLREYLRCSSCRGRITRRCVTWPRQSLCFALSGTRGDVLRSTWSGLLLPRRKILRTARRCLTLTGRRSSLPRCGTRFSPQKRH